MAWIARNLQNIEYSIFGPKPFKPSELDDSDFDLVDINDNNPTNIKFSDVENIELSKNNNSNRLNWNDLMKLLNYITSKLPIIMYHKPLYGVNNKAIDKSFTSFMSMANAISKALVVSVSSMTIYSNKYRCMHAAKDV